MMKKQKAKHQISTGSGTLNFYIVQTKGKFFLGH